MADSIQDCSKRSGVVLECFVGSGVILVAAERTGRRGYGIELDPRYIDVALQRLAALAGLELIHSETGTTFAEVEAARLAVKANDAQ